MTNREQILITIISEREEHLLSTYTNEYRSLMSLIKDKLCLDGFGQCDGMGRCATCMVQLNHVLKITGMERNESSTLSQLGIGNPSIRLSCQLLIDVALQHSSLTVLSAM